MNEQHGDQQWFEEVYVKAQGDTNNISWADLRPMLIRSRKLE